MIDLSKEDPELLVRMFQWVYADKYALLDDEDVNGVASVIQACVNGWQGKMEDFARPCWEDTFCMLHLNMFAVADYYLMEDMCKYALQQLRTAVTMTINIDHVLECIEALGQWENISSEHFDKLFAALVKGLTKRSDLGMWTPEQVQKLKSLCRLFPKLQSHLMAEFNTKPVRDQPASDHPVWKRRGGG